MEAAFCSVLMEAAMKMASLTDAGVFVLLETREGRKFCGNKRLCEEYRGGGVRPKGGGGKSTTPGGGRGGRGRGKGREKIGVECGGGKTLRRIQGLQRQTQRRRR